MEPSAKSEASHSIINCLSGFGYSRIGAVVKVDLSLSNDTCCVFVQRYCAFFLVSSVVVL